MHLYLLEQQLEACRAPVWLTRGALARGFLCLAELALPCQPWSLACMKVLGKPVLPIIAVNGSLLHEVLCCSQAFAGLHSNSLMHGQMVPGSKRWAKQKASKPCQGGSGTVNCSLAASISWLSIMLPR